MAPLVVFEGIDGSGKSTQIQILHDTLVQKGYNPLLT
ncbi:MAG: dTMP kinase, partial [Chloroflexi bacterium]|nr:dTMP kinase [Chloroflexota bacterium]